MYAEESAPDGNIDVSAKAAILICADSGKVLYAKNENQQLPMASTTKIMTALLAFEKAESLDNEITITDKKHRKRNDDVLGK